MNKKFLYTIIVASFIINSLFAVSPKREWRSTWLATVSNIDWPSKRGTTAEIIALQKQEMLEYLDGLAMMNMNAMCFQVRPMSDAFYKSSYEPWSYYLTDERGKDPGWDPLEFVAEECHKRGMDCYVWINPYRWSTGKDWSTEFDKKLKETEMLLSSDERTYLNPGLPEVREHIVKVCKEIITEYNVQGLIFDDYFYPNNLPTNESAGDYKLWKNNNTDLSFGDWRRANVDQMIKDVYDMIQEYRPDLRFGISPANSAGKSAWKYGVNEGPVAKYDWQYDGIYSDPISWLNSGTIDFISPQEYVHTDHETKPFEPLTDWWDEMATHFGRHHYTSLSISCLDDDNSQEHWDEHVNQTLIARRLARKGIFGLCYFSTRYLNGPAVTGSGAYFKEKLFSQKSLTPIVDWKKWTNYSPVDGLIVDKGYLRWNRVENGNAIIRYTVYAIPRSVSFAEALTEDGLSNEYLLGVSFSNEYKLLDELLLDYWYAVCVYDGYGHESRAAVYGYEGGISPKVELISPTIDTEINWDCNFSWTSLSNGEYCLEIASDSTFETLLYKQNKITENNITVNLDFLEDGTVCYWRIEALEGKALSSISESSKFVAPIRRDAEPAQLLSPQNGAEVSHMIEFVWNGDKDAKKFTLEIARDIDFTDVCYKEETTEQSMEVPALLIETGTRYWRVMSEGLRVNKSMSSVGKFTVVDLGVGNYELDYEIKKDPAIYSDNNGISINNLWMRSVKDGFNNIDFEDNGKLNRDFVAKGGYVYLAGRRSEGSSTKAYLRKYYGTTGECLGEIIIKDINETTYSSNTITKDDKGRVCMANMSTSVDIRPIYIHAVDEETGKATLVATLTSSGGGRIDHIAISGDVMGDCFYVFGAIKGGNQVVRWTVRKNDVTDEVRTLESFYPSSATSLGTAPRVIALSEDFILVDGSLTAITLYDFSTGKIKSSFAQCPALAPKSTTGNGGNVFRLNDKTYMVYALDSYTSTIPNRMQMVSIDSQLNFQTITLLWTLPQAGLGDVSSGTLQNMSDFTPINEQRGILYVYVPGNGLCAYEITDKTYSSAVVDVNHDDDIEEYYNLQGMKVNKPTSGIYIQRKGSTISKVIIGKR